MQISRDLETNVSRRDRDGSNSKARTDQPETNVSTSGADAARMVARRAQETIERRAASRAAEALPDGMELRIGDCRTVLADVPDASGYPVAGYSRSTPAAPRRARSTVISLCPLNT
jgi:hypothetical protein